MKKTSSKIQRQLQLKEKLKQDPFLTDEECSEMFSVSVPTVRLDRIELGIPELRERIKNVAADNYQKVKAIEDSEFVGELIELNLGKNGISILQTDKNMVFEKSKIVRGHFIYAFAETLAISVIDSSVALIGVANIKYINPVYLGSKLVAKAEVKSSHEKRHVVWVKIKHKQTEVFRGKFILISLDEQNLSEGKSENNN